MVPQTSPDDLKRDLQATLTTRRELGPEYDEHFLDALVEKLTEQVQELVKKAAPRPVQHPPHDQRMGLAVCSLIFGIPLVAIGTTLGAVGFIAVCLMILGINVAFALLP
jgi:hypothetical protein